MIGAYYETKALTPYSVGAVEQTMSDVAASTIQTLLSNISPLTTVIPWATEETANWVPELAPEVRYALYPIDAATLDNVTKAAFGQPVGFVALLDTVMRAAPERLFDGTPWEFFQSQAVFSERDPNEPPTIQFLYWGKLRDQSTSTGSASTLEAKAKAAQTQLVYPITLPIEGAYRGMPTMSFADALSRQTKSASPLLPPASPAALPAGPMPGSAALPAATSQPSGWGGALLLFSVAAVGGYVAYRVARGR